MEYLGRINGIIGLVFSIMWKSLVSGLMLLCSFPPQDATRNREEIGIEKKLTAIQAHIYNARPEETSDI